MIARKKQSPPFERALFHAKLSLAQEAKNVL